MRRTLSLFLIGAYWLTQGGWGTDFQVAKDTAAREHKYILLNFSGSDWCGPCIRLKKDIFGSPDFLRLAETTLVLVNADFPRQKKNQLSKELQKQNDALADSYNPTGVFPMTVLLSPDGKVVRKWEGYPGSAQNFINDIKKSTNAPK